MDRNDEWEWVQIPNGEWAAVAKYIDHKLPEGRVEGSITTPPLPSETVLATFTAHGYSMCFLLSL